MADGVEEKTYSAKQVATRIGTDAKQLRKFFRDPNSGYSAVGQGGRYEFPESQLQEIKQAFDAWNSTKVRRNRSPQKKTDAPVIPGQRKESPGTETTTRTRRPSPTRMAKEGLHGNAMDEDTLQDRMQGIKARVQKHGLVPKGGRLVPGPRKPEPITYPDLKTIPGLDKPAAQWLDFRDEEEIEEEKRKLMEEPTDEELKAMDELFELEDDELEEL